MIVDTSALAAILFEEAEMESFLHILALASSPAISAGNWVELTTVLARRGRHDLIVEADRLRLNFSVSIAALTETQSERGRTAYLSYGKGSGHPAKLNFGDCFAYALAKESGRPLLFKGDDFVHTDIEAAA